MSLTPPKSLGQPTCSAKNTDVMICSIMVSVTWEKCYFELKWVLPCHDFAPQGTWNLLGEGWVLGRSFAGSQLCVQPFSLFGPWCRTGRILLLESSVSQGSQHKTGSCKRLPSVRGSCWVVQGIQWGWKKQLLLCLSASFFIWNTSVDLTWLL